MRELLGRCVDEDGGIDGDVTTHSIISSELRGRFTLNIRGLGTIAGLDPIAGSIDFFHDVAMELLHHDGEEVKDANIAIIEGSVKSILLAERTILNIIGYASGVATRTKMFVDAVEGTGCKVCDTRKTTPGLRQLDKYAVSCGGGTSHRFGLHDAALYKDNHLVGIEDFSGELQAAIESVRTKNELKFVEIEVDTLEQLANVLQLPIDIVLLDNMSTETIVQAVAMRNASGNSPLLEASGGVSLETVREIAETGVDRISIGGLVHQATWIDVGLDAI
jgi:nicotinate-nucleotide pyrophosphorylase (carboxylating)